jgi:hypothetical protein
MALHWAALRCGSTHAGESCETQAALCFGSLLMTLKLGIDDPQVSAAEARHSWPSSGSCATGTTPAAFQSFYPPAVRFVPLVAPEAVLCDEVFVTTTFQPTNLL